MKERKRRTAVESLRLHPLVQAEVDRSTLDYMGKVAQGLSDSNLAGRSVRQLQDDELMDGRGGRQFAIEQKQTSPTSKNERAKELQKPQLHLKDVKMLSVRINHAH